MIRAQVVVKQGTGADPVAKHRDQFRRRVREGRCFATPFLGCREFSAGFAEPSVSDRPRDDLNGDLGPMLLDVEYAGPAGRRNRPHFFAARLEAVVLWVPPMPNARGA